MVDPEKIWWSIQEKFHGRFRKKSMFDPEKIHGQSRKNSMVDQGKISCSIQKWIHGRSRKNPWSIKTILHGWSRKKNPWPIQKKLHRRSRSSLELCNSQHCDIPSTFPITLPEQAKWLTGLHPTPPPLLLCIPYASALHIWGSCSSRLVMLHLRQWNENSAIKWSA